MGSTGSGRISDYPGSSKSREGSGDSNGGGGGTDDRCARAISVALEDIEHCEYFIARAAAPLVGQVLRVALKKRVVAETEQGLTVGNFPTSYNYLAACLKEGWTYVGSVRSSTNGPPVATVTADFGAAAPP
jgi:hypothetical protein